MVDEDKKKIKFVIKSYENVYKFPNKLSFITFVLSITEISINRFKTRVDFSIADLLIRTERNFQNFFHTFFVLKLIFQFYINAVIIFEHSGT